MDFRTLCVLRCPHLTDLRLSPTLDWKSPESYEGKRPYGLGGSLKSPLEKAGGSETLGATNSTPEINTSEIIVDFQWHFPMDCNGISNIISLISGIFPRIVTCPVHYYLNCPMDFQWHFPIVFHFRDFRCVIFCPETSRGVAGNLKDVNPLE